MDEIQRGLVREVEEFGEAMDGRNLLEMGGPRRISPAMSLLCSVEEEGEQQGKGDQKKAGL